MRKTDDKVRNWVTVARERLARGIVLSFERHHKRQDGTRREAAFDIVAASDWGNGVALTPKGEVVLVEQFRHGTEQVEIEIPGGIIDEGEGAMEAAIRELREETGYAPGPKSEVIHIGTVRPNPAIMGNHCHTFLITDVVSGETAQDELEEIRVRLASEREVVDLTREGKITHSLVIAALWWLHLTRSSSI